MFHNSLTVCVYMYARVCVPVVHARAHACGGQKSTLDAALSVSSTFLLLLKVFLFLCVCMRLMCAGIVGGQKRAPLELDPLELEL